jgi:vitamin B12 transporter
MAQEAQKEAEKEAETPVVTTEEVVTSATKTPVPVSQLTSAVEVITGEEMQRQKFKTVIDALRLSTGTAVWSSGGPGTEATVQIRGASRPQTLVLIDGAIVNSATTGYYNFANVTTDNIERVEILRGAQSMLWGSDAMGGVINITTKRGTGKPTGNAFFEYGSFNSIREGGQVTGKQGLVDYTVALSRWDFSGFSTVDYRLGAQEKDSFRNWTGSSRLGIDLPHDGRFDFSLRWMNGSVNLDNITTPADVFASKTKNEQFIFSGVYDQVLTTWWNQKLTLSRALDTFVNMPGSLQRNLRTGVVSNPTTASNPVSETRVLSNRLEWQHNVQVVDPLLLTFGYQYRQQQADNNTGITTKSITSNAGFAQAQFKLFDERLFGTAGLRYDSYNTVGEATTYRLTGGYLHKETDTKFRTSYATGFRAPSVNDLYFPGFGRSGLRQEKSQSFDAAIDQYVFGKDLLLSAGFFYNRYRDLIVTVVGDRTLCPNPPFTTDSCPQNVGSAVTKGYEISAAYTKVFNYFLLKAFDWRMQYTNTMTRDVGNNTRLPRVPVDQWSTQITYQPIDPLNFVLTGRVVGSRYNTTNDRQNIPGFAVWNLTTNYDVTKKWQTYIRVDNLFNQHYQEILNAGTPVRSIYFGIKLNTDLFSS